MPPKKPAKAPAKKPAAKAAAPEQKSVPLPVPIEVNLKQLNDLLMKDTENKVKDSGKWPLVMDQPEGQSTTFLRYQDVNFLDAMRTETMEPEKIRKSLLGAVRYGKPLVLDMSDVNMYKTLTTRFDEIQKGLLQSIMDKSFIEQELYLQLVKPEDGDDYDKYMFNDVNMFKFIILSQNPAPEEDLLRITFPIKVV